MTYETSVKVDPQRVQDMISGAFEGGSNYWLGRVRVELISPKYSDLPEDGVVLRSKTPRTTNRSSSSIKPP
jgi:hypothetical protein